MPDSKPSLGGMIINSGLQIALLLTVYFDMLQNPYSSTKAESREPLSRMTSQRALSGLCGGVRGYMFRVFRVQGAGLTSDRY